MLFLQLLDWMSWLRWLFLSTSCFTFLFVTFSLTIVIPYLTPAFLGDFTGRYAGTGCPLSPTFLGVLHNMGCWEGSGGKVVLFVCFLVVAGDLLEAETNMFSLLGHLSVSHPLSVEWWRAAGAPTQFPPATGNSPELHVGPLPRQGRVYDSKRHCVPCGNF